jgi:hypothetical protein
MAPGTQTKRKQARDLVAGLSEQERAELLAELADEQPGTVPVRRDLTPRERLIAGILRERDHLDGCPVFGAADRAIARVEAYDETRPAGPARPVPEPVAVFRCLECGGSRYLDGTVRDVLLAELRAELRAEGAEPADGDLDGTL